MHRSCRLMVMLFAAGLAIFWPPVSGEAMAQNAQIDRFERQLEQIYRDTRVKADTDLPADQRALIDYGGYFTFSFVTVDDLGSETHILRQSDLNLFGRVNLDGAHEFFARGHSRYRDWNSGDDFDGHGDDWEEFDFDRLFYVFDLQAAKGAYDGEIVDYNVRATLGRQLVTWGNGLTLSEELDAADVVLSWDNFSVELLGGRIRPSTRDFDSSRPNFGTDTDRFFYGVNASYRLAPRHTPYVYFLKQNDKNDDDFAVLNGRDYRYGYDSWYAAIGSRGNLGDRTLYGVEFVYEGGETYSETIGAVPGGPFTQTRDDIEAFAFDFQLDYLVPDANRSRLNFELLVASGDNDRNSSTSDTFGGNDNGTKDHAFNGFGLLNTGIAFAPNISNLTMIRAGASTYPIQGKGLFERFQVGTNLFGFFKTEEDGPIDEPTNGNGYLGFEADLYVNWQLSSDLAIATRYGAFFPGEAIESGNDVRHFFYTGITLAF